MINQLLLIISIILILISYFNIIYYHIKTSKIETKDMTAFDLAKELTSNYNEINIVESKEINISKYNLKRKIIRLTKKDYESKNIYTLGKISLLSGYSLITLNKDKNLELLSKVFSNLDYLNKSSIITILISLLAKNKGDAKIAIIILIITLIYQYLINEINNTSKEETNKLLKKTLNNNEYSLIEKVQDSFLKLNKISFITTLILITREVLIIIS